MKLTNSYTSDLWQIMVILTIIIHFSISSNSQTQKCFRVGIHADMNMFTNIFTQASGLNTVPSDTNGYLTVHSGWRTANLEASMSSFQQMIWSDSVYVVRWDGDGDATITNWYNTGSTIAYNSHVNGVNGRIEFKVHYTSAWSTSDFFQVKLDRNATQCGQPYEKYQGLFKDLRNGLRKKTARY